MASGLSASTQNSLLAAWPNDRAVALQPHLVELVTEAAAKGLALGSRMWGQKRVSAPGKEWARSFY